MSNYTVLTPFKFLVLGALLMGSAYADDETYPIRVPAQTQSSDFSTTLETGPLEMAPTVPAEQEARPAPVLRQSAPLRYEVKKGDTLWGIAGYFLQNPWQWPEIWYSNDQIKNPHRIYPGNILRLVMVNGRPRLLMGDGVDRGTRKLSPRIRGSALSAIPAIPTEAIRDFLRSPKLITKDELDGTPYLLDFTDNHMIGGADTQIFVKNLPARAGEYSVVRKGEAYIDPETDELLGYEAIPIGLAEAEPNRNTNKACKTTVTVADDDEPLDSSQERNEKTVNLRRGGPSDTRSPSSNRGVTTCNDGSIGFAIITKSTREARVGDRLLPLNEEFFDAYFYPRAPERDIRGSIISVFDGASQIGRYQVVALNRGAKDGLAPGHVLTVMQTGRTARDPESSSGRRVQLPATEAGTVMVFKVMPHLSYALVMDASREMHAKDGVVNPQ
jgi:hypothetical protein